MGFLQNLSQSSLDAADLRQKTGLSPLINFKPSNTRKLRKAIASVRNKDGNARIGISGESIAFGTGAGESSSALTNAFRHGMARHLSDLFAGRGLTANYQGRLGSGAQDDTATPVFDSRIALGAGWATTVSTVLGQRWFQNTTTTNALVLTPNQPVNTWRVWYYRQPGNGQGTVDVGGANSTAFDTNGANAMLSVTVTSGSAADLTPLNIKRTAGGVAVGGWEAWDSANPSVVITNLGWPGSKAADYALNSVYRYPAAAIGTVAFDCLLHCIGINDEIANTDLTTWKTQMGVYIAAQQAVGDFILISPFPSSSASVSLALQDQYTSACYDLAATHDIPLFDSIKQLTSWADLNSLSLTYDFNHPKGPVYADAMASIFAGLNL